MAIFLVVCAWSVVAHGAPEARRRAAPSEPRQGELAPDFTLPRLDPFLSTDPAAPATLDTVRLSSFKGKRPVVLIFSSYT